MARLTQALLALIIAGTLAACASKKPVPPQPLPTTAAPDTAPLGPPILRASSRWVPVRWAELPGIEADALNEAWNAWIKSCERPQPPHAALCPEVRRLSLASVAEQRAWLMTRFQPYRVEPRDGSRTDGLLTSYYEPLYEATRLPSASFSVPLYRPPAGLRRGQPWYTRQQMDTVPQVRAALQGTAIMYLNNPIDALVLQIQGSGRVRVTEPDGSQRLVRLAFAATNEQPYQSVGKWLLDRREVTDATWPGIKAWIAANPSRVQEMLWANPRVVFFREEPLAGLDAQFGPRGAQGVALTPGRSIAVDPGSIPYGTPVWLASPGPSLSLSRLVLAQDTGSAIRGAVRADYFAGWGQEAGDIAGRLKQPLQMWVLWPRL